MQDFKIHLTGSDKVQRNKNNRNNEEYDKELKNNKEDNSVVEDDGYASVGNKNKKIKFKKKHYQN